MSRKHWTILAVSLGTLVLLGALGAGGAYLHFQYRHQKNLKKAEEYYAAGQWEHAKNHFAWYLTKHREDTVSMAKYAQACENMLANRRGSLREAGIAYFEIAKLRPEDDEARRKVLSFCEKHGFWKDLEYRADYFLRQRPDDRQLQYYRALAQDRSGARNEAVESYTKLMEGGGEFVDAYLNLIALLEEQGYAEQVRAVLEQFEAAHPDSAALHRYRAERLLASGDVSAAENEASQALERAPEDTASLLLAGRIAFAKRDWDAAADLAERVLALAPDEGRAYLMLSTSYERKGLPDKAISLLESMDPYARAGNPELFVSLAEMQITNGRYDDAHKTMETYGEVYPEHQLVLEYLSGRELLAKGQAADAASKFSEVVEGNPDFVPAQFYEAVALLQGNQRNLAKGKLEIYIQNHPDDTRARALWDRAFGAAKTPEKAYAAGKSLLDSGQASADSLVLAAQGLITALRQPGASGADEDLIPKLLEEAISRAPVSSRAYVTLADYLLGKGDVVGARGVLDKAAAAGVSRDKLVMLEAAIVLSSGETDRANGVFREQVLAEGMSVEDVVRWATLFAQKGGLEAGLEVLSLAVESEGDIGKKGELLLEGPALCVRFGDLERALALLKEIEAGNDKSQVKPDGLNTQKMFVALALRRAGGEEGKRTAESLIQDVEKDEPDNPQVRLFHAESLLALEQPDYAAAESLASAVVRDDPENLEALLILYDVAVARSQYGKALEYSEQAAAGAPGNVRAMLALAQAQIYMQQEVEAVQTLERVLASFPDEVAAMKLLVRAYWGAGQASKAEDTLRRLEEAAAGDSSKQADLDSLRAWLAASRGDLSDAMELLQARHEAAPDDFAAVQALAQALSRSQRRGEAERLLKQYAEAHEKKAEAWLELGQFYLGGADPVSLMNASSAFTRALFIMPDYAPALRGLISIELRNNSSGTALVLCDRYLASQPDDVQILYQKALLLMADKSRSAEAFDTVQKAIGIKELPDLFLLRGLLYLDKQEYKSALEDLQRVADIQGVTSARIDAAVAEAYMGMNEPELARQYYEAAIGKKTEAGDDATRQRLERLAKRFEEGAEGR